MALTMSGDMFTLTGTDAMRMRIKDHAEDARKNAIRATYEEMLIEEKESRRRTPIDTGALVGSHETVKPEVRGNIIECSITVGGPAAPYAWYVHENLDAHHPHGQAKFLESTLRESARSMAGRIARRMGRW